MNTKQNYLKAPKLPINNIHVVPPRPRPVEAGAALVVVPPNLKPVLRREEEPVVVVEVLAGPAEEAPSSPPPVWNVVMRVLDENYYIPVTETKYKN